MVPALRIIAAICLFFRINYWKSLILAFSDFDFGPFERAFCLRRVKKLRMNWKGGLAQAWQAIHAKTCAKRKSEFEKKQERSRLFRDLRKFIWRTRIFNCKFLRFSFEIIEGNFKRNYKSAESYCQALSKLISINVKTIWFAPGRETAALWLSECFYTSLLTQGLSRWRKLPDHKK